MSAAIWRHLGKVIVWSVVSVRGDQFFPEEESFDNPGFIENPYEEVREKPGRGSLVTLEIVVFMEKSLTHWIIRHLWQSMMRVVA